MVSCNSLDMPIVNLWSSQPTPKCLSFQIPAPASCCPVAVIISANFGSHESIYPEFVDKLAAFASSLKTGSSDEPGVMLGPIQNEMQYEKVKTFFEDNTRNGYKFIAGDLDIAPSKGFFIKPTIIDNPPNDSRILREEPFGPILPIQPWSDLDEVIDRANNINTGLGASLWTKDVAKREEVAQRLEAGNIFVNSWTKPTPQAFFSRHKESGIGGECGSTSKCPSSLFHLCIR
jgi:acyl-CoA reductase-like NAD-dependent aldehyde dehydrogenase